MDIVSAEQQAAQDEQQRNDTHIMTTQGLIEIARLRKDVKKEELDVGVATHTRWYLGTIEVRKDFRVDVSPEAMAKAMRAGVHI